MKPAVLAYHKRELSVLANVQREPTVLEYHHRNLVILANLWKQEVIDF
jgi:hypothetical protein